LTTGSISCTCRFGSLPARSCLSHNPTWRCAGTPSSAASTPKTPITIIFPVPARITLLLDPSGPGIRRDSGMYEGWNVPVGLRSVARQTDRLRNRPGAGDHAAAASARRIFRAGIKTNISLFQRILRDADFQEGKLDTGYLERFLAKGNAAVASRAPERGGEEKSEALETIAAIAAGMFCRA